MKVKDVMTAEPKTCTAEDTLAKAAGLMWENDCGILPVVFDDKVVGLLTDRDICMAAVLKGMQLSDMAVSETITGQLFACKPNDELTTALNTMRTNKVHRLPVIASDGTLQGLLSMNDVVLRAEEQKDKKIPEVSYGEVVETYKAICQHRVPIEQAQSAAGS
jgi:CBS domain-containing protein